MEYGSLKYISDLGFCSDEVGFLQLLLQKRDQMYTFMQCTPPGFDLRDGFKQAREVQQRQATRIAIFEED